MSAAISGPGLFAPNAMGLRPMRRALGPAGFNEVPATNLLLQSGDLSNAAAWARQNSVVAAPVVTGNATIAPDGTLTAANIVLPAVSGASAFSWVGQSITVPATTYTYSIWLRGAVGGEQLYIGEEGGVPSSAPRITLTTQWQRYVYTASLTATSWTFYVGTELRDNLQTATPGPQSVYAWGAQVEAGAVTTSYIPTGAAAVARDGWTMRPPDLGGAPAVSAATGLGTGGGAGTGVNADQAWGNIRCIVGQAPATSGTVVLQFPSALPATAGGLWVAAEWASIVVSGANPYTLTWTGTRPLIPGEVARIAYEWVNAN